MAKKKSLLLIEPFTALPTKSGGRTRIYNTIIQLEQYFDLTVWSFISNNQERKLESEWLTKFKIKFQHYSIESKSFFSFLLTGIPYWFSDWYNQNLIKSVTENSDQFSNIQVEFSQLLYLVDYLSKNNKKIFVAYDIASVSFWRSLKIEKNLFKKIIYFIRFLEVYYYERKYLPKFDLVIAVSNHDRDILKNHFKLKKVSVISNAIDGIHILEPRIKDDYINLGFIGSCDHPPNQQAIKFLINNILPQLEIQKIKYKFYFAGNNSKILIDKLISRSSINQLGYIDAVESFYKEIDLLIAPIFSGSGSRIKILESLSYGRPVITTKIGAEGIDLSSPFLSILNSKEMDPLTWTKAVIQIQEKEDLLNSDYEKLRQQLSQLTWEKVFENNFHPKPQLC